jgi:hypothetical protein
VYYRWWLIWSSLLLQRYSRFRGSLGEASREFCWRWQRGGWRRACGRVWWFGVFGGRLGCWVGRCCGVGL